MSHWHHKLRKEPENPAERRNRLVKEWKKRKERRKKWNS